jgi:hypothetical protein
MVPLAQRWKAVEQLMMFDRATEELKRVADDMQSTVQHFCLLHDMLSKAVNTVPSASERALLLRKLLDTEVIMQNIWQVAKKNDFLVPPMPSFSAYEVPASLEIPMRESVPDTLACVDSDSNYDSDEDA